MSSSLRHEAETPVEILWRAAIERDASYDGSFVFGVRTTGIYCRPSCPAQRPRRENVVFFDLPGAAEQAGFRPCKRCRPQEHTGCDPHVELARRVCGLIDANLGNPLTLAEIGARLYVSPHHLQHVFKRVVGVTPRRYAEARRFARIKARLKGGESVSRALFEAGYGSSSRLYESSSETFGMTPATYRKGGRGMRIGYTLAECSLGLMLVGATEKGVCAVYLGDSEAGLESGLRAEYPTAEIRRDDVALGHPLSVLLRHLDGEEPHVDLPLEVRATAFQRRVWDELGSIPCGETRTYGEIARSLGQPTAARAVARACATNPVSIAIPCHRVVRSDGQLGGYRWGLERKQALQRGEKNARWGNAQRERATRYAEDEPRGASTGQPLRSKGEHEQGESEDEVQETPGLEAEASQPATDER